MSAPFRRRSFTAFDLRYFTAPMMGRALSSPLASLQSAPALIKRYMHLMLPRSAARESGESFILFLAAILLLISKSSIPYIPSSLSCFSADNSNASSLLRRERSWRLYRNAPTFTPSSRSSFKIDSEPFLAAMSIALRFPELTIRFITDRSLFSSFSLFLKESNSTLKDGKSSHLHEQSIGVSPPDVRMKMLLPTLMRSFIHSTQPAWAAA
mmetsp:Transcript_21504/g.44830  ORF Transcript_21504/g.44830 Transcript_21504/m.44830 type:complete len:211 (+) Transcript_21504:603-1235(+)